MGPISRGDSIDERNMAVGPSAPPIIPIEAASLRSNPKASEEIKVINIPSCAAAPNNISRGGKVSHSANSKEDKRWINPFYHTKIKVV